MRTVHTLANLLSILALVLFAFALSGCDAASDDDEFPDPELTRVTDLPADPIVGVSPEGRPIGLGLFTFYSLRENEMLTTADSATTAWDVAFRGTDLIVNGGTTGPGNGAVQIVEGTFDEVLEAPETGWNVASAEAPAIPPGSGSGWYNYNPATNIVSPIPGRVVLIRTADGLYAKLSVVSYYRGAPDTPTAESESRYVTFDYVLQPDGSRQFE
jgi:hypothetical protein